MRAFRMDVRKGDFSFRFTGEIDDRPQAESGCTEMVAAMREGLEANGFEVEASFMIETMIDL